MGISRSHAARTKLQDELTNVTRIVFPVFLQVGNGGFSEPGASIGVITASSSHQASTELANLLRAVADEIDPNVVTVVREDTETATHGRPVETVSLPDADTEEGKRLAKIRRIAEEARDQLEDYRHDVLTDPADRRD